MKPLEAYFLRLVTVIVATMPSGMPYIPLSNAVKTEFLSTQMYSYLMPVMVHSFALMHHQMTSFLGFHSYTLSRFHYLKLFNLS